MKFIFLNVQGLRTSQKRIKVLRHLQRLKADVALLQEMHIREEDFPRIRQLWVGEVLGSPLGLCQACVLVLLHKHLDYLIKETHRDEEGRKILILLQMQSIELRVTNVYALNLPTRDYFNSLSSWLVNIQHQFHVVGGDFNSVMDDTEDKKIAGTRQKVKGHRKETGYTALASTMEALHFQAPSGCQTSSK